MSAPDASPPTVAHREARTIDATERACERFVERVVDDAGADGVVVPMDGGVGSATAATLAVEALGADAVFGLVLPGGAESEGDERGAQQVADALGVQFRTVDLGPVVDAFAEATTRETWLPVGPGDRMVAYDHVRARDGFDGAMTDVAERVRTAAARFEADTTGRLVLGTADRTDRLLGETTAGAADLFPLGDVYRTEVRALARHLDVPETVVRAPPASGPAGLDATYGTVDSVLWLLAEAGHDPETVTGELDVDAGTVDRVADAWGDPTRGRSPPTPATYAGDGGP